MEPRDVRIYPELLDARCLRCHALMPFTILQEPGTGKHYYSRRIPEVERRETFSSQVDGDESVWSDVRTSARLRAPCLRIF